MPYFERPNMVINAMKFQKLKYEKFEIAIIDDKL